MEMASHEKERERAPGACACPPADAARMGAPGRTHVCARAAREVLGGAVCGGVPGLRHPGELEGGGTGTSERREPRSVGSRRRVARPGGYRGRHVRGDRGASSGTARLWLPSGCREPLLSPGEARR